MRPIAIFRHAEPEGPGYFADILDEQGIPWRLVRIDQGEEVPQDAAAFSGLVFKTISDPYTGRISLVRVFSGKINPDSEVDFSEKAYSSSKPACNGCKKSARQRTHWAVVLPLKSPWKSSPWGVRLTRTFPEKSLISKSGESCRLGKSK